MKVPIQGNNGSSNSWMTDIHWLRVKRSTHCATPPIFFLLLLLFFFFFFFFFFFLFFYFFIFYLFGSIFIFIFLFFLYIYFFSLSLLWTVIQWRLSHKRNKVIEEKSLGYKRTLSRSHYLKAVQYRLMLKV